MQKTFCMVSMLLSGLTAQLSAQTTDLEAMNRKAPFVNSEVIYSAAPIEGGAVRINITAAGFYGLNVSHVSSSDHSVVMNRMVVAADKGAFQDSPNIVNFYANIEPEAGAKAMVFVISEVGNPKKSFKLMVSAIEAMRGRINIKQSKPNLHGARIASGGDEVAPCPEGTHSVTFTNDRCGTVATCCSSPQGVTIDAVACAIHCAS